MEENTSNALFIGTSVFIFVAAISSAIILLSTISKVSSLSLEKLGSADKTILERVDIPPAYVIKGVDVMSYYANYVVPGNSAFEFYLSAGSRIPSDVELNYNMTTGNKLPNYVDSKVVISDSHLMNPNTDDDLNSIKANIDKYYIKVVTSSSDVTQVYFVPVGDNFDRAEFMLKGMNKNK
ncbi:MAG: hypothetical protein RR988_01770 [Clostridia bacterium]